jgi:peptidyl-prolyl cis-trans isomerase D
VSDAELIEKVQAYPAFQVNGHFDHARYLEVLRGAHFVPADFEQLQREDLLLEKLEHLIKDSVQVTDTEVKQAYVHDKGQVNVEYVRIDPAHFAAEVEVSEDALSTYYQEHLEQFRRPEQVRIGYAVVDPESFAAQVELTAEQLAQYYEEHKDQFHQEEQVRARHILFKLPPQAGADADARTRAEAEAARLRIQAGEDFAVLASQLSQDPVSAQQGGDLGFFKRGEMVKPFEEVAFTLEPGSVSDPVRTDFGYHIIKVEERQAGGYEPLEAVQTELRAQLTREESRRLAEAQAQALYEALVAAGSDWKAAVEVRHLIPHETALVAQGEAVEGIEHSGALTRAAFALQEGEVGRPSLDGNRYLVTKLLERKASYIPPLEAVKDTVQDALVRERSRALARQKADAWLAEVQAGRPLEQVAQTFDTQVEQTGMFSRNGTVPNLGRPQEFMREVFQMRVGEARVMELLEQPAVVVLKEQNEFDAEDYEQEKTQLRQQALRQKREQTFSEWANEIRRQAEERGEISVNQNFLAMY